MVYDGICVQHCVTVLKIRPSGFLKPWYTMILPKLIFYYREISVYFNLSSIVLNLFQVTSDIKVIVSMLAVSLDTAGAHSSIRPVKR